MGERARTRAKVSIREFRSGPSKSPSESEIRHSIFGALTGDASDLSAWPKYLYNAKGSEIFEKITEQPEYYQTRTELSMLRDFAREITEGGEGEIRELVELGSGSSSKTRALLEAMVENHGIGKIRYVPLDVSESAVEDGADSLERDYPGIEITGYVGDFDGSVGEFLSSLPRSSGSRLVIFLGGTIGNSTPSRRKEFLEGVRSGLDQGDRFLVGVDLVKDTSILESAYNDPAGVTADFNKNVLASINEMICSDFDPELFEHRALYNEEESMIEMWLLSTKDHDVSLGDGELHIHLSKGEGIRTEISAKFTLESVHDMFEGSGMRLVELYTDERELFGLALGEPER